MPSSDEDKRTSSPLHEAFNAGDLDSIDEMFHPDWVHHSRPGLTLEILKREVAEYRAAFPDLRWEDHDRIEDGDKVAMRFSAVGTHTGELMGIPPTGKKIVLSGMSMTRYKDGKIIESWEEVNALGMMIQMGALPEDSVPYVAR